MDKKLLFENLEIVEEGFFIGDSLAFWIEEIPSLVSALKWANDIAKKYTQEYKRRVNNGQAIDPPQITIKFKTESHVKIISQIFDKNKKNTSSFEIIVSDGDASMPDLLNGYVINSKKFSTNLIN